MRLIVGGAATAALLLSTAPAVIADPGDPGGATSAVPPADGRGHIVTLVTGDRVTVAADGTTDFAAATGRENIGHRRFADGDALYVVPNDAVEAMRDGRVDRRLFDVTGLIRDGYADRDELPLIVSGGAASRSALAGGTRLDSVDATASVVAGAELPALWSSMSGAGARSGATRIVLDGKARLTLDQSVPQIGAPAAWEAGYDGTGVTIAVLDSGWDPTHPDLVDRVTKAENFTDEADAVDRAGHGTHVTSIAAGTGAGSAGRYKGVAPGANVIVGKVCTSDGYCTYSDMIEGMEWAAAQGASVVNISIGGSPFEGDPTVEAVERLTAETGTLFVIAAGNNYGGGIDSPGVSPSALTVGSVTKSDEFSDFSSQGPAYDYTMKPDLVAPGSAITAAQAAGTGAEGELYVAYDGTSMATPHVTGAVALLKQRHPDWTAERLKDALVGSAKGLDALDSFQEGAGRLDVGRGVAQEVYADGSLSFGLFKHPQDQETVVKDVTYTNDGDADVTLAVTLTGAEGFTVDRPQVTVPAGGNATVSVSYDPDPARGYGNFGAELVATDGTATLRTAVGASTEPELYTVDFPSTLADGETLEYGDVTYWNLDTDERGSTWDYRPDGTPYARLTPGRYAFAYVTLSSDGTDTPIASFTDKAAEVHADMTVAFDAASAGEVTTDVTFAEGEVQEAADVELRLGATEDPHSGIGANMSLGEFRIRLLPGSSNLSTRLDVWQLFAADEGEFYLAERREGPLPDGLALSYDESDLGVVEHVIHGQGAEKSEVYLGSGRNGSGIRTLRTAPGTYRIHYTPGQWGSGLSFHSSDFLTWEEQNQTHVVTAGTSSVMNWNKAPLGAGFGSELGVRMSRQFIYVDLGMFSGPDLGTAYWNGFPDSRIVLSANGETVLDTPYAGTNRFEIPPGLSGDFTFTCEMERDVPWSDIGTKSTVEFGFSGAPVGERLDPSVNLVRLNASGVRDGYAKAKLPQVVSMRIQPNNPGQPAVKSLTFEVSYDDGKTWKKVPSKLFGDTAVSALVHPRGATGVSTRISTVDADGNTSVQTAIRSYGLK
ncbi:S8 family peptidase [Phytomonospora endophytica]|uniref:Subtilisin family serine protease n=1 Tax=Phytomonospora endophytica TaxID=714109 RepID=A0A841FAK7_9ACTN|nr:S8 family serine peptidase [Phytomonospora endophytica]MBB6034291.1 subtilisin family serine protease [Phytomonospora endophytica]GIG66685.1 serine protease [Phytomonospora endophytica]